MNDADDVLLPFGGGKGSRRSFLRLAGFGVAASVMTACSRGPVRKTMAYLEAPDGIVVGRGYRMATTCSGCTAGCGVLAKCRDGRPIKLEGLPGHPVSGGGLCAVGQGEVLSLYDAHRFDGPRLFGKFTSWAEADRAVLDALRKVRVSGGKVRVVSETVTSPSTEAAIEQFLKSVPDGRLYVYDPLSASAILDAHEATHGVRTLPNYRFDQALVIASFDADFLGTWISPVEFARGYAARRRPEGPGAEMSRHWQFEARMSLTGGRADERWRLAPWEVPGAVAALRDLLAKKAGAEVLVKAAPRLAELDRLATELWAARGRSIVVCGVEDVSVQTLVNEANELLGNYGKTLDLVRASHQKRGRDGDIAELRKDLNGGEVELLIVHRVNPAYDATFHGGLGDALTKARLLISTAGLENETSKLAHLVVPEPHPLESWDDGEPLDGVFTLTQPTVPPLRSTRTLRASLAHWNETPSHDRDLLEKHWKDTLYPRTGSGQTFPAFFRGALHDGFVKLPVTSGAVPSFRATGVRRPRETAPPKASKFALVIYPKVALLDGRHAQNPWLQELPDPVSRLAWESYVVVSPSTARRLHLEEGDVVDLAADVSVEPKSLRLPIHIQPGQHDGVLAVARGYGCAGTDRFAHVGPAWWGGDETVKPGGRVGDNVAPWLVLEDGTVRTSRTTVSLTKTGRRHSLATVQDHQSLEVPKHLAPQHGEVRDAVRSVAFESFKQDPVRAVHGPHEHPRGSLWPSDKEPSANKWGMVVDLTSCTGCSSCVIACQAENNIPVVGRDEVRRHREMSWIRIDRYHQGDGDDVLVSHQPMMCQHCDNAPCESVCPVLATMQSSDGLNQQVYNRCVGTRYCANTCPYKVRRFNWFDYQHQDELQNHALNPDVTVRSRGVMEKCSMCVQRIQDARIEARRLGVALKDGDIQVACQDSCPTRAITFGDLADAKSEVANKARSQLAYRVLEETNVEPAVRYLAQVRNQTSRGQR